MAEVVAPQASLRFEFQFLGQRIVQVLFLAVDEGWQPDARLNIGAPAVEMEVPAGMAAATVSAVEADHVEVLILDPDTAQKAPLAGFWQRSNVEHQAAYFTQEFAPHIVKFVMLLVESAGVDKDHLQETVRQVLHGEGKEVADAGEDLLALAAGVGEREQAHGL